MLTKGVKIGFTGFLIAMIGAVLGFGGFQFEERWVAVSGFVLTALGVFVGFVGILHSWITNGKQAISGSVKAAKEVRDTINQRKA